MASRLCGVVTGASSGIGAGVAKRLLANNWNVALVSLPKETTKIEEMLMQDESVPKSFCKIIGADLTDTVQVSDAYNRINVWLLRLEGQNANNSFLNQTPFANDRNVKSKSYGSNRSQKFSSKKLESVGALHGLFNCCGAASKLNITLENCSIAEWNYHINVNLTTAFLMSQYFIPNLTKGAKIENDASIINIGSIFGKQPFPGTLPYNISKAAIHHLTQASALELASKDIRVNAICPSAIETNFHKHAGLSETDAKNYYEQIGALHYSAHRVGKVEDCVEMIMFLVDKNKAKFITGQCIDLDAGRRLTPPMLHSTQSKSNNVDSSDRNVNDNERETTKQY